RVGAFTSPHLVRFNERIRFDGRDATDAELVELFESIDASLGSVTLSYFEASAVAALLCFARRRADVAVLEVGMGGRLDAVNALDADAALDRKSTRLNSSHVKISYAVFCLKKKKNKR